MDLDFQPENLPPKPEKLSPPPVPSAVPSQTNPAPTTSPAGEAVSMINPQPKSQEMPTMNIPSAPAYPAGKASVPTGVTKRSKLPLIIAVIVILIIVVVIVFLRLRSRSNQTATQTPVSTFPTTEETDSFSSSTDATTVPSTSTPAGRDAQRKENLRTISTLLAAYYADNQVYPIVSTDKLNSTSSIVARALVPKYSAKLPVDPLDPDYFYGYSSSDGKKYELSARIEDPTDKEATLVGSKYLFIIKK